MQRAADKVVQRILRETAQWMVARPEDTLRWRLPKPTAAFANWSWMTLRHVRWSHDLAGILEATIDRLVEAERDGRVTFTMT